MHTDVHAIMESEWDAEKAATYFVKHGVRFADAVAALRR
jgi:uncharacterized DUF497 family protein